MAMTEATARTELQHIHTHTYTLMVVEYIEHIRATEKLHFSETAFLFFILKTINIQRIAYGIGMGICYFMKLWIRTNYLPVQL